MEILVKATCQQPADREASIIKMVEESKYSENQMVKQEYGMTISEECATVNARVLPAPKLKYGVEREVFPVVGQWKMANMKMYIGGTVDRWTCLNFSQLPQESVEQFCKKLVTKCSDKGMNFEEFPCVPIRTYKHSVIEKALSDLQDHQLQLLIIILPDVTGSYGKVKTICETKLGIVSQCCQSKQLDKNVWREQYLENIALKINVKAGGTNAVLCDAKKRFIPLLAYRPTAILGADVTHAQPGEDSSASIAAVVCSMDWPEVTKYRGVVRAQGHRVEIIQDLCACVRELLIAFINANNQQKPYRIIFYRDGVSEGQFAKVLSDEVNMIREACKSIDEKFQPPITFVVVQKRHHTRLFPVDPTMMDVRSKNILPGTVLDSDICNPSEFDFYLCSHAGIHASCFGVLVFDDLPI